MTDIIERVARALCRKDCVDPDEPDYGFLTAHVRGYAWEGYIPQARAAIAAMREPTPEMIEAGLDAYEFWGRTAEHVADDWRDMIDAALKETDNG